MQSLLTVVRLAESWTFFLIPSLLLPRSIFSLGKIFDDDEFSNSLPWSWTSTTMARYLPHRHHHHFWWQWHYISFSNDIVMSHWNWSGKATRWTTQHAFSSLSRRYCRISSLKRPRPPTPKPPPSLLTPTHFQTGTTVEISKFTRISQFSPLLLSTFMSASLMHIWSDSCAHTLN